MNNITIIGGGTLAVLLAKLQRKLYKITRIKRDVNEQIKRIGVYYMCIADLLNKLHSKAPDPRELCQLFHKDIIQIDKAKYIKTLSKFPFLQLSHRYQFHM